MKNFWVCGITDMNGLRQITQDGGRVPELMILKAATERNVQAVAFRALLDGRDIDKAEGMISRDESREALKFIKSRAKNIGIEKGFEEAWRMLPFYKIDCESLC